MPPLFVEKNIGIQKFKHDPSLSEERDREDRDSGPTAARRAATRPTCRSRWTSTTTDRVDDRRTGSDSEITGSAGPGRRPGLVGRHRARADRSDRGSLRVGRRSARGQRHPAAAAATKTVGGRYVFHHMTYSSVQMGERGSADEAREQLADSRGRTQRRHLPAGSRPAAAGRIRRSR